MELPDTWCVPVIRADFSDDALWARLQDEIASPTVEGFLAGVEFVEDRSLSGLDTGDLVESVPRLYWDAYRHPVMFIVDAVTITMPEHPLLVIDLHSNDPGPAFRAIPRQVQSIENNLSIANMDFIEFARAADPDGIFRGFDS